jgi:outer membrane protein TolC
MRFIPFLALAVVATAHAQPLSLADALSLAESRSPQLAAQRAAAEAAAALVPAARENPDAKLIVGVDNLPVEGSDKWSLTADNMTMRRIGVMQDFVRGEKRELRETRASAEAQREAAMIEVQRADLRRDVATAWLERFYAERSKELVQRLAREADLAMSVSSAELAAGKAPATEGIAARALRATLLDRRQEAEQKARRASAMLVRWLGDDADRPLGSAPDIRALSVHHTGGLEANLESHPHLAMYAPMEAAADAEMRLAAAATKPDWSMELTYNARGPAYANMVSLMFRMDLPLFESRRQAPVTASKLKALEQVRAQAEDAKRRHIAEIRTSLVDWEISRERLERHERELVPLAEERSRAATAGYEGGRTDLAAALEARRNIIEAKLAALNAELEVARAWAQLAFLLPERKQP